MVLIAYLSTNRYYSSLMEKYGRILVFGPVLADLLAIAVLLSKFGDKSLQTPSGMHSLYLGSLYSLLCIGVYLIRKLKTPTISSRWQPPAWLLNTKVRGVLALLFGLMLVTMLAFQLGYFVSALDLHTTAMDEGDSSAFFVFAPGAWLGFSMLYILVSAFPVNSNIEPGNGKYVIIALLGLLFVQGLLIFTVFQIHALFMLAAGDMRFLWGILSLIGLLIAFVPPRVLYQRRVPFLPGWLSLLVLLLVSFSIIMS